MRYATTMTNDETQHDTDETHKAQGLPDEGPGSRIAPPSNPDTEPGEEDKAKAKLEKILNG